MMRIAASCLLIAGLGAISLFACGVGSHDSSMSTEAMATQMREMNEHMAQMLKEPDPSFDIHFIDLMIPHHEGAIAMAKEALAQAKHPELKKLAEDIITSQQKEIEQLKQWREGW